MKKRIICTAVIALCMGLCCGCQSDNNAKADETEAITQKKATLSSKEAEEKTQSSHVTLTFENVVALEQIGRVLYSYGHKRIDQRAI